MNHSDDAFRVTDGSEGDDGWKPQEPWRDRTENIEKCVSLFRTYLQQSDTNLTTIYLLAMNGEPKDGEGLYRLSVNTLFVKKRVCACEECETLNMFNMACYLMWLVREKRPTLIQEFIDNYEISFDMMDKNRGPSLGPPTPGQGEKP